jgi:pyrroline-5-carboxylate reductase
MKVNEVDRLSENRVIAKTVLAFAYLQVSGNGQVDPNPVVRAMPNTPCIVGEGMTVVCGGKNATSHHIPRAQKTFQAVGKCLALEEKHFDAVTALSGSGPLFSTGQS